MNRGCGKKSEPKKHSLYVAGKLSKPAPSVDIRSRNRSAKILLRHIHAISFKAKFLKQRTPTIFAKESNNE